MSGTLSDGDAPRGIWDGIALPRAEGSEAGVEAALWPTYRFASILAAPGGAADLSAGSRGRIGVELPLRPQAVEAAGVTFVWSGAGHWLAFADRPDLADYLGRALPNATIVDQTGSRGLVALSGPKVRELLAKGSMVDLHPRAFRTGDVAVTSFAHVGVHLWLKDEGPTFVLAVARSFAGSFWAWLSSSAAPFGLRVTDASATRRP